LKAAQKPRAGQGALATLPDWLRVGQGGGGLVFTRRWFQPVFLFLAFFCLMWDGFLVVWYGIAFATLGTAKGPGLMMFVFPLIHVAVGVGLTYYTICGFFNRTEV